MTTPGNESDHQALSSDAPEPAEPSLPELSSPELASPDVEELFGYVTTFPPKRYFYCPKELHLLFVLEVQRDVDGNPICPKDHLLAKDVLEMIPDLATLHAAIQQAGPRVRSALGATTYRSFQRRLTVGLQEADLEQLVSLFYQYPPAGDLLLQELLKLRNQARQPEEPRC